MSNPVLESAVDAVIDFLAESKFDEATKFIEKYELGFTVQDILDNFGGCCNVGIDEKGFCKACKEHCL